jgi:hypothetical protein
LLGIHPGVGRQVSFRVVLLRIVDGEDVLDVRIEAAQP